MKPASSNLWTSAFIASTFISDILRSFCFLGLVVGLTCNRCSIMSLVTPTRSEVDHAKTSLFLLMNASSSACSCWLASAPMHTVLSGTLGVQRYFLELAFEFYGFLAFYRSFCFVLTGKGSVLLWVFSQEMYIFVAWREALLDVSGFLLTVNNRYNSKGYWYLEAEVS
jgi:hypothetical protein